MRDPHVSDDLMLLFNRRMSVMENFNLFYGCFFIFINTFLHKVHTIEEFASVMFNAMFCHVQCLGWCTSEVNQ